MTKDPFSDSDSLIPEKSINKVRNLPDGSSVFEILGEEEEQERESRQRDFYENLAEDIESAKLSTLAASLLEDIEEDKDSRKEWEQTLTLGLKYLGIKIEESSSVPFLRACAAYDSELLVALIRGTATARAELFPAAGPARSEIIGVSTEQSEDEAERVRLFMNHFLTQMDEDYYPDSEQLINYTYLFGSCFRKVFQDPILNQPRSRMIKPQDFIINAHTTSLLSSDRMTDVRHLTKRDVILNERKGEFIDCSLPLVADDDDSDDSILQKAVDTVEGVDPSVSENKSLFDFYECHTNLDDSQLYGKATDTKATDTDEDTDNSELPKPYIVTICCDSKKIVSIKRNWEENDETFKRIECFIHYYYLAGFGLYGLGLAHLLGSNSITLTSVLRILIDSATLQSFPGGLKTKGLKVENNDKAIGPGEFHEVETGGLPLNQCVMQMPYSGPSPALIQLRQELIQQTSKVTSAVEDKIPEIGANAPVGTALAVLEIANIVQSSVLRSAHVSLGRELKLLFKLFGKYLPNEPYPFAVPGSSSAIMRKDFNDRINIVPVSDPRALTSAHRLIVAEFLLKTAQSNPEMHDLREVYKRLYTAMNIENIDKILIEPPQPESLDPLTENAMMALGKPITVAMFQDDEAHITAHKQALQDPMAQANPQLIFQVQLHIQSHKTQQALKQMIQQMQQQMQMQVQQLQQARSMGVILMPNVVEAQMQQQMQMQQHIQQMMQLPIEQVIKMPEIQNMIAAQDAQEINQQIQQQQQEMQEQKAKLEEQESRQIDPNQVAAADIEQHREASVLKDEEAKSRAELQAETEAFKAQLRFESDMAKIESQENIATDKNQTDLAIEQIKHEPNETF